MWMVRSKTETNNKMNFSSSDFTSFEGQRPRYDLVHGLGFSSSIQRPEANQLTGKPM
jgi:hypothetical protein